MRKKKKKDSISVISSESCLGKFDFLVSSVMYESLTLQNLMGQFRLAMKTALQIKGQRACKLCSVR